MEIDTINNLLLSEPTLNSYQDKIKINYDSVPVPKDLDELVTILREIFSNNDVDVNYVKKVMANYKSNRKDWSQYAKYDPHR